MSTTATHFPVLPTGRHHDIRLESVELRADILSACDAVLLIPDHSNFPYQMIADSAALIVDTRNAFGQRRLKSPHIVTA